MLITTYKPNIQRYNNYFYNNNTSCTIEIKNIYTILFQAFMLTNHTDS